MRIRLPEEWLRQQAEATTIDDSMDHASNTPVRTTSSPVRAARPTRVGRAKSEGRPSGAKAKARELRNRLVPASV